MTEILVVIGSARPNRVADSVLKFVADDLSNRENVEVKVADLRELDLPFMNSPVSPAAEEFAPTDERVIKWTKMVESADGVIFLTPEYNHAITAIQKNALDWIKKEWTGKKVSLVGYGWGGGQFSLEDAHRILEYLGAKPEPTVTQLFFTKQLNVDGTPIDEAAIKTSIAATVDELLSVINL